MAKESPGRMIRKSISESKGFASLTPRAAVLFTMLIPHYNAHGKMHGGPGYVKEIVCPLIEYLDSKTIPGLFKEISDKTNVKWFEKDGRMWLHSLHFLEEHQELRKDRMGPDLLPNYSETTPGVQHTEVEVKDKDKDQVEDKGKDKGGAKVSAFVLASWIDSEVWSAYEEMRIKIKKPMTDRARKNIIAKLEDFKSKGHDPTVVLDNAITGSWQSVYEPKEGSGKHEKHRLKSFAEQDREKQQQIRSESQRQAGLSREDVEIFGGDQPESVDRCRTEDALPVGVGSTS